VWQVSPQCGPACHADRLHKGSLGNDCQRCHEGGIWRPIGFDHDKESEFPLVGFHRKVQCLDCHPKRVFKPTRSDCYKCHKQDDAHAGALGRGCEKCHEPTGKSLFVHNTMSRFKLDGKHVSVGCDECHASRRFKPEPNDCFGCHERDDVHRGQYGTGCERCHQTKSWKSTQPIHDVGVFRLAGAHDHIQCDRCHGPELRPLAGTGDLCITCHRQDDIHHNSLGPRCGDCHTQWSFAPSTFVHATVGCDLRGIHRVVTCSGCHRGGNYMALSPSCVSCHRKDALAQAKKPGDVGHMGFTTCAICHNPNFWAPQQGTYALGVESVCR
jgi:hypothetical protein